MEADGTWGDTDGVSLPCHQYGGAVHYLRPSDNSAFFFCFVDLMKTVVLGTNNPDKLGELKRLLRGSGIKVL